MRAIVGLVLLLLVCGCSSERGRDSNGAVRAAGGDDVPVVAVAPIDRVNAPRARVRSSSRVENGTKKLDRKTRSASRITTGPTVQVSGHVAFEDGTPLSARLATATVELWRETLAAGSSAQTKQTLDISEIGENGRYLLAGPDGENLRVEVVGVSRAMADLKKPAVKTTASIVRKITQDFLIPAPHKITGRVVNGEGQPVTSAVVSLRSEDVKTDGWYYGNQQTSVTATGDFSLEGVAAGPATIGAGAPGLSATTMDITVPTSGPVVLRLTTATATINGYVLRFPTDVPVAGATVKLEASGKAHTLGLTDNANATASTATDGSFQMTNVPAGEKQITINAADGSELFPAPGKENEAAMAPEIFDDQTTAMTLRVFEGYTITGLVYDKDTSEPLSGAEVTAFIKGSGTPNMHATSDESGNYKLEKVGASTGEIGARLEGFAVSQEGQFSYSQGQNVVGFKLPEDSETITADIPMVAVVKLSGRVENKEGLPVANADVNWGGSSRQPGTPESHRTTDADGRFQFELMPFQDGVVEVKAAGYAFKRSEDVKIATQDVTDVVIVLDQGGQVEGRVVNPEGEGVSGASITMRDTFTAASSLTITTRDLTKSEADGYFHIDGLETNKELYLTAKATGYAPGRASINLQPGDIKTGVEITLAEPVSIEGRVVDADDKPVKATLIGMDIGHTQTNDRGEFKISGISPGKVEITVQVPETRKYKNVTVEAPAKDVVIRLDDSGTVAHCKVVDSVTKRPIEKFNVTNVGQVTRDGEGPGGFSFSIKPKSMMMPKVSAEGYVTRTFEVTAPAEGGDFEQVLEMGLGSGVNGRVVDGQGEPVADIPIVVYEEAGSGKGAPVGNSVSDSDGKFLVSKVPAGKVRVTAMPRSPLSPASKKIELKDGEFQDVGDIVIERAGSIIGNVVRVPSGDPVSGSYVNIYSNESEADFYKLIITGADGVFQVDDLSPRKYSINVNGHIQKIDLQPGENRVVLIELGSVTLTGTITRGGAPAGAMVGARNKQTGKSVSGNSNNGAGVYRLADLVPGDYDLTVTPFGTSADKATSASMAGLQETITLPDQEKVVKDFVLP